MVVDQQKMAIEARRFWGANGNIKSRAISGGQDSWHVNQLQACILKGPTVEMPKPFASYQWL